MAVLAGVWAGVLVTNVRANVVISTLSGVLVDVIIDVLSDVGVEVLNDVNSNVLVAKMTAVCFAMPSP